MHTNNRPKHRPTSFSQKTLDGLKKIIPEEEAAYLCNIRGSQRAVSREESVLAFRLLFDTVAPILEMMSEKDSQILKAYLQEKSSKESASATRRESP